MDFKNTPFSVKSDEAGLLGVSGVEVFKYTVTAETLGKYRYDHDGRGVEIPFVITPNRLIIPSSHDGKFGWMREYASCGNSVRARSMKILAGASSEVVIGNDGFGGAMIVDGGTDIDAFMEYWRTFDVNDKRVFDGTTVERPSTRIDRNLTGVIGRYRTLIQEAASLKS